MVTTSLPARQAGSIPSRALYNMATKVNKPQRPKKPRYTVAQVADAIQKSAGNLSAAARGLGVNRTTIYDHINKSPVLQRLVQEERESLVDMAESALRAEVLARNMTAVIWTLKASPEAKRRGWGERTEVTGANGSALVIQMTWGDDAGDADTPDD